MSTGEIIREKRKALGMTQAALAEAVQVEEDAFFGSPWGGTHRYP